MFFSWRIRYLDTRDRKFKDRDLWLDTDSLDPVTKAAVQATYDLRSIGGDRGILRFRHLFHETRHAEGELTALCAAAGRMAGVFLPDYFEDENGEELTHKRMAVVLSGNPNAVMFPPGTTPHDHDIDYVLAEKRPIPVDEISLSQETLYVLALFERDLREMLDSAFYKEGPGSYGGRGPALQTAATAEEIRSFVTIFRRLYMTGEPANFVKAAAAFGEGVQDHPLGNWVKGVAAQYEKELGERPLLPGFAECEQWAFSKKRLIDVFLYTQYAHQPDEQRARQFRECLESVGGNLPLLTWLFLITLWHSALHIRSAGTIIADLYNRYCLCHRVSADILASVQTDNPGIGTKEKKEARRERILRENAEGLAFELWKQKGRPEGGPAQFLNDAREQLEAGIARKTDTQGNVC